MAIDYALLLNVSGQYSWMDWEQAGSQKLLPLIQRGLQPVTSVQRFPHLEMRAAETTCIICQPVPGHRGGVLRQTREDQWPRCWALLPVTLLLSRLSGCPEPGQRWCKPCRKLHWGWCSDDKNLVLCLHQASSPADQSSSQSTVMSVKSPLCSSRG